MKRVMWVVVCLAALVIACGGPTEVSDAGKKLQEFYAHLNDGNHDAAFEMYSSEVREMLQNVDGSRDDSFSTWAGTESREGTIGEVKIASEEVDESTGDVTVTFQLNYSNGQSEGRTVVLSKADGNWKLGFVDAN